MVLRDVVATGGSTVLSKTPAAFFREVFSANHGMQIYGKRRHCSLLLREETSDA